MPKPVTISAFGAKIEKISKSLRPNVAAVMNKYGAILLEDFKNRSAVDSGAYKRNWRFIKAKPGSGGSFSISLKNATTYAQILVAGADVGGTPWFFPSGKSKKDISSPSKKLFVGQPRGAFGHWLKGSRRAVWAGGLNPGKEKAIGGVKAGLLSDATFQKEFMADLRKAMVNGL